MPCLRCAGRAKHEDRRDRLANDMKWEDQLRERLNAHRDLYQRIADTCYVSRAFVKEVCLMAGYCGHVDPWVRHLIFGAFDAELGKAHTDE